MPAAAGSALPFPTLSLSPASSTPQAERLLATARALLAAYSACPSAATLQATRAASAARTQQLLLAYARMLDADSSSSPGANASASATTAPAPTTHSSALHAALASLCRALQCCPEGVVGLVGGVVGEGSSSSSSGEGAQQAVKLLVRFLRDSPLSQATSSPLCFLTLAAAAAAAAGAEAGGQGGAGGGLLLCQALAGEALSWFEHSGASSPAWAVCTASGRRMSESMFTSTVVAARSSVGGGGSWRGAAAAAAAAASAAPPPLWSSSSGSLASLVTEAVAAAATGRYASLLLAAAVAAAPASAAPPPGSSSSSSHGDSILCLLLDALRTDKPLTAVPYELCCQLWLLRASAGLAAGVEALLRCCVAPLLAGEQLAAQEAWMAAVENGAWEEGEEEGGQGSTSTSTSSAATRRALAEAGNACLANPPSPPVASAAAALLERWCALGASVAAALPSVAQAVARGGSSWLPVGQAQAQAALLQPTPAAASGSDTGIAILTARYAQQLPPLYTRPQASCSACVLSPLWAPCLLPALGAASRAGALLPATASASASAAAPSGHSDLQEAARSVLALAGSSPDSGYARHLLLALPEVGGEEGSSASAPCPPGMLLQVGWGSGGYEGVRGQVDTLQALLAETPGAGGAGGIDAGSASGGRWVAKVEEVVGGVRQGEAVLQGALLEARAHRDTASWQEEALGGLEEARETFSV